MLNECNHTERDLASVFSVYSVIIFTNIKPILIDERVKVSVDERVNVLYYIVTFKGNSGQFEI